MAKIGAILVLAPVRYAVGIVLRKVDMRITRTLRKAIIECLKVCQDTQTLDGRKALVSRAALDARLARPIIYGGSVPSFCKTLVQDLEEYGNLEDGRHTLQAILEAACPSMDGEWVEQCEVILKDLRLQLTVIDAAALVRSEWHVVCGALTLGALFMLMLS